MRLTQWTDYSLRVLMYCAAQHGRALPVTITEIQQAHGISRHHLTKVVVALGRQGYLETTRGRGGGLRLLRPAQEIGLGQVVRDTETDFRLLECFDSAFNTCRLAGRCRLELVVQEATARFLGVLDDVTLADLAKPPQRADSTALAAPVSVALPRSSSPRGAKR